MSPATNWARVAALTLAALPLSLLVVASRLEPESAGLGTHQQLGLPPCSMRLALGIRCPGCGMTTSWAYFTQGQWFNSFLVNSGGFCLALLSLIFAWLAMRTSFTGKYPSPNTQQNLGITLLVVAAITFTDWLCRLTLS